MTPDLLHGVNSRRLLVNRRLKKKRVLQKLVYVERIDTLDEAVSREMALNRASRRHVDRLVESVNPGWDSISLRTLVARGY